MTHIPTIVATDIDPLGPINLDRLNSLGNVHLYGATSPDELIERVRDADIIITNKVKISADTIDACPTLKLICVSATGTDNVDTEHATAKGIPVKNVTGYSTTSVAQHTFSTLLALTGQIAYYDQVVKSGEYAKSPTFTHLGPEFHELHGKTFAILGMGDIGKKVASIAHAFGCEVVYGSRSDKDLPYSRLPLEELLARADILTLHTPLTPETKNMLSAERLSLMKPTAILVNMARGGIVDEKAAADMLDDGQLGGLATDVFSTEPCPADNPLLHLKNPHRLIATPHIAWAARESRQRLLDGVCDHIEAFVS